MTADHVRAFVPSPEKPRVVVAMLVEATRTSQDGVPVAAFTRRTTVKTPLGNVKSSFIAIVAVPPTVNRTISSGGPDSWEAPAPRVKSLVRRLFIEET